MSKPTDEWLVQQAVGIVDNDNNTGICINCGAFQDTVEPDAERYKCGACGERAVYGAEQIILMKGDVI